MKLLLCSTRLAIVNVSRDDYDADFSFTPQDVKEYELDALKGGGFDFDEYSGTEEIHTVMVID